MSQCAGTCEGDYTTIPNEDLSPGTNAIVTVNRNCTNENGEGEPVDCGMVPGKEKQTGACSGGEYTCEDLWYIWFMTWNWNVFWEIMARDCPDV